MSLNDFYPFSLFKELVHPECLFQKWLPGFLPPVIFIRIKIGLHLYLHSPKIYYYNLNRHARPYSTELSFMGNNAWAVPVGLIGYWNLAKPRPEI